MTAKPKADELKIHGAEVHFKLIEYQTDDVEAPKEVDIAPAAQLLQVEEPLREAYVPTTQLMQLDDEVDPVVPRDVPATQFTQLVDPTFDW